MTIYSPSCLCVRCNFIHCCVSPSLPPTASITQQIYVKLSSIHILVKLMSVFFCLLSPLFFVVCVCVCVCLLSSCATAASPAAAVAADAAAAADAAHYTPTPLPANPPLPTSGEQHMADTPSSPLISIQNPLTHFPIPFIFCLSLCFYLLSLSCPSPSSPPFAPASNTQS